MALRRALVLYKSARRFCIKKEKPKFPKVVQFRFLLVELSYILTYGKSVVAPSSFVLASCLLLRMLLARTAVNSAVLTSSVTHAKRDGNKQR